MKSIFSQISKSSLCNYAMRLAIFCVFLSISVAATATSDKYAQMTAYIHPNSTGEGCVYVTENKISSGQVCEINVPSIKPSTVNNIDDIYEFTYTLTATPTDGFYAAGWTQSSQSMDNLQGAATHTVKLKGTTKKVEDGGVQDTWYAVFKPYISTSSIGTIVVKQGTDGITSTAANINALVYGSQVSDNLSATLIADANDPNTLDPTNFKLGTNTDVGGTYTTTTTDGTTFSFTVSYAGSETDLANLIGKNATIKLSAEGKGEITIKVPIKGELTLTFKGTNGRGTYKANLVPSSFDTQSNDEYKYTTEIGTDFNNVSLQLLSDELDDGYIFFGWQVTDDLGNSKIFSYAEIQEYNFSDGDVIDAIFVPNGCGYMVMAGASGSMTASDSIFSGLHEALGYAGRLGGQRFVVFENLATIFTKKGITCSVRNTPYSGAEGMLPYREGGYTIPKGVTLLIPGTSNYEYAIGKPDISIYKTASSSNPTNNFYRKLIVEDNTRINVKYGANISVFSYVYTSGQSWFGMPINYGWIELGNNSVIQLGDSDPTKNTSESDGKAGLYILGYITNSEITNDNYNESWGKVIAYNGSQVYEVLQFTNWRGGTVGLKMAVTQKDKRVFPILQYFFQNIESPLIMHSGAEEYLVAYMDLGIYTPHLEGKFIDDSNAFFCLGENAMLTKYYDKLNDKQRYIIEGTSTNKSIVSFDELSLPIMGNTISMNSSDFVMPITTNMDISLYNVEVNMYYDVCLLAGTNLYIHDNAVVSIAEKGGSSASVFMYDKEEATYNGTGYMGSKVNYIYPLAYTPYGSHTTDGTKVYSTEDVADLAGTKYKRKYAELQDATVDVNGKIIVGTSYGSAAGLYTTSGGANIISSGKKGIIKFNSICTKKETNQVTQPGDFVTFTVTQAVLTNDDGEKVATLPSAGIVYRNVDGKWITTDWNVEDVVVTKPTDVKDVEISYSVDEEVRSSINGTTFTATISGTGFCFVVDGVEKTSADVQYDETNDLKIGVRYKAQDTHGATNTATITFKNKKYTNISYSTTIKATEDYKPQFSISPVEVIFPEVYVNTSTITKRAPEFALSYNNTNVASLQNDETYANRLAVEIVSVEPSDNPFEFVCPTGVDMLSNATLSFTPPAVGNDYSATFVVKMTYTDKNGNKAESDGVTFTAKAKVNGLTPNTLCFTPECEAALQEMCVNKPVELKFDGKTANRNDVKVVFENNGATPILSLLGDGTNSNPYKVVANAIPDNMPTIRVTQDKDLESGINNASFTYTPTIQKCEPTVQWNWSDMYFGYSYDNPIKSNSTGDYTLTLKSISRSNGNQVASSTVMTYDDVAKTAEVKQNTGEYVATFEFSQEGTDLHAAYPTTEFTAHIYASPAQLPLCVENERIFTAINHKTEQGTVIFNATAGAVELSETTSWIMTFIGVPDVLSFTPTTNTNLTISGSQDGSNFGEPFFDEVVVAGMNYQVEINPVSVKYIKITVVDATTLRSLCLTALNRVRLEPKILYLPISNDPVNNPTVRTVKATYVNNSDKPLYMISSDGSNIIVSPNQLEPTAAGEYKEIDITISSKAISEFAASVSVEHKEGGHAQVDIETYRFPQKLPIQLEKGIDPAKRFHFVTTAYKNTEWDAAQYAIKMQNKTTTEVERPFVTFAFDGAPSFISFVPVVATTTADWLIEEGIDATTPLHPVTVEATMENGELKQMLDYTTRYVRVTYVGTSAEVVQMTKVNILSDQSAIPNPEELELTDANKFVNVLNVGKDLDLTVVNLTNLSVSIDNEHFTLSYGSETPKTTFALDADDIAGVFGEDVVGAIPFKVFWDASQATDFGNITFTTEVDGITKTLATVPLVGTKAGLTEEEIIYTGVKTGYTLDGKFEGIYGLKDDVEQSTAYRKIDLSSTYDSSDKPLFDYLIIYGETTTTDGTTNITTPTTTAGSNAKTPMYIYYNDGSSYKFWMMEENVNTANKAISSLPIAKGEQLRIYITGFCPYATTGYTKEDEGVWYFQGVNGAKLDIYLEDCYIYSRHKTLEGRAFSGRYDGQAFSEGYVRGSGGVLVFENQDNDQSGSFDVTIHTRRNNMFKSNYGCFFELMQGMRAYNVSSPIQVHLASDKHKANSKTTLTFDDKWPNDATNYDSFDRTNGYLSLQKQVNNAPSIDLGNANTIVNFRGGQVELQNAAVVSPNYKTTFAISFRSGLMAGFPMAYGIGTDDVGGEVYFYDGTTTVIPMEVDIKYRDYYLMDTDANGKEKTTTSCLRTPTNTYVYGGSHCMMRACEDVTSKGGAPTRYGNPLGLYKYPKTKPTSGRGGFGEMNAVGLVTPTDIPTGYNAESVTPNTNGTPDTNDDYLNFWFSTEDEPSVTPEVDKKINFWKACMTQISAEYMSYGGTVGGETMILPNEENKYLLYCQIDENISNVISAGTGFGEDRKYTYMAPVKDPTSGQLDVPYLSIPPSYVGEEYQNYIETVDKEDNEIITGEDYTISEKVYYVVPTTADTWMTFTAPFNVEKLWIVEAYEEAKLAATPLKEVTDEEGNTTILNKRQSVLLEQAKHNADFAAFFGVAMALGREQTFEEIHKDYEGWAEYVDKKEKTRGKIELEHYNGNNFYTANYYLYRNAGEWTRLNGDKFDTKWEVVGEVAEGGILMHQGETYSMLFPYCTGCDVLKDENGQIKYDANGLPQLSGVRDYWDYWSGKFLIFESTQATSNNPHTIKGSNYHEQLFAPATSGNGSAAVLTGNSTFALLTSNSAIDAKVYTYSAEMGRERFKNNTRQVGNTVRYQTVQPTVSFLIADIPAKAGAPARGVMRTGEIIYGKDNTATDVNPGGNIPTVGGGNDLFITSTVEGINIAVAEPQHVRVLSSTGAVLYSGMVQTAVDVALPTTGVYVITGENEVHKILH